jgi:predicted ArsR family transcriptional regulator
MNIPFFPRARTDDPDTSHAAAAQATDLAAHHHSMIINSLKMPGTIYDIADRTGLNATQVARRMSELESMSLARAEGKAEGRTGRMCRVWWKVSPKKKPEQLPAAPF